MFDYLIINLKLFIMKFKTLLFFFLISFGALNAQDTIRSLIISEARLDNPTDSYIEITNVGDEAIDLSQFKLGELGAYQVSRVYDPYTDPITPRAGYYLWLPDVDLAAGESFVVKNDYDFGPRQYRKKVPGFESKEREIHPKWRDLADILIQMPETGGDSTDQVSPLWQLMSDNYSGRQGFYIEQHLNESDSVTIDQVNGVFDNDGKNFSTGRYDVAGVAAASATHVLVRKYSIKKGNPDYANARGNAMEDSEWMPVPLEPERGSKYREIYWTVGNHGDYNLDENTLVSVNNDITIDFTGKKITVPYYIRRGDGIIQNLEEKPGVAWRYLISPATEDTLAFASRSGDKLVVFVCGNDLDVDTFDIVVSEPATDANIVVPVIDKDAAGNWRRYYPLKNLIYDWPWVTEHASGPDTITGVWYGLPYATRVDSLLERLEKPANASWEIVWVDEIERPDLKDGDVLKVTAENGSVKKYYIQLQAYQPDDDAGLVAITWPDIPVELKGIFGWKGDTIPNFSSSSYNYRISVPAEYEGIPALVPKKSDLNSTIVTERATNLTGSVEESTVKFIVTAENGIDTRTYIVELAKEQSQDNIQPYHADPFVSELVNNAQFRNRYMEIVNPGNQPLDMSDYMIASDWGVDPTTVITNENTWMRRYNKYVPGYKWVDETTWGATPARLEPDLNVSTIVQPGEVFVLGTIREDNVAYGTGGKNLAANEGWHWQVPDVMNVQFATFTSPVSGIEYNNPWNEDLEVTYTPAKMGSNGIWIFKILNDSVKNGKKPATDPKDFELVESIWNNGTTMMFGGRSMPSISTAIRKPHIYMGNPVHGATFGETPEDSEWTLTSADDLKNLGISPTSKRQLYIENDIGMHYMIPPTHYMSTVKSSVYKVSEGYSLEEEIRGPRTSETVDQFLNNIIKVNEGQTLKVMRADSPLANDAQLNMGDVLEVLSADSVNTTKYTLEVTEEGLSSDAVLTSTLYEITVNDEAGAVSGFEYGTLLSTVVGNVALPDGATMTVIDGNNAYVPFKKLNFDTTYVDISVNQDIYFEVVAEDGVTTIVYQLQPNTSEEDAFILSDVYMVSQEKNLVEFVPRGTIVQSFMDNIVPALGASVKIVNKMGQERTDGALYQDDKVVVVSANGEVTRVYHLSMLRTQYILDSNYLAYILSNTYSVDQLDLVVSGPTGNTLVTEFTSNITAAPGATAVVVDASGNTKTSDDLNQGDMVKVTSADGRVIVMYEIDFATSTDKFAESDIKVYPNPTSGKVNIQGLEQGTRIQVFNQTGALLKDIRTSRSMETISLDNQPSGMYLLVLTKNSSLVGQYKVIRR